MKLSQEEKDIISQEIENLEKFSSAELIAVVTKKSENYKYANSLLREPLKIPFKAPNFYFF